jgi:hypothetical protein
LLAEERQRKWIGPADVPGLEPIKQAHEYFFEKLRAVLRSLELPNGLTAGIVFRLLPLCPGRRPPRGSLLVETFLVVSSFLQLLVLVLLVHHETCGHWGEQARERREERVQCGKNYRLLRRQRLAPQDSASFLDKSQTSGFFCFETRLRASIC